MFHTPEVCKTAEVEAVEGKLIAKKACPDKERSEKVRASAVRSHFFARGASKICVGWTLWSLQDRHRRVITTRCRGVAMR